MDWFTTTPEALGLIILSTVCIYAALTAFTRLFGIRSFSKMSGFDFAVTVAFGSILASVIVAKDPPVAQGVVALFALFTLQFVVAALRRRSIIIRSLVSNSARLIMVRGEIIPEQLKKAKMTRGDLIAKLREANVFSLSDVEAVIAETTGDVSVLHQTGDDRKLDPVLLEGVIGSEKY